MFPGIGVIEDRQTPLFQIIIAVRPTGRFPCRLNSGEQQRDENANDGDHD